MKKCSKSSLSLKTHAYKIKIKKTIDLPNGREDTREGGVQLVQRRMSGKAPAVTSSWCYDGDHFLFFLKHPSHCACCRNTPSDAVAPVLTSRIMLFHSKDDVALNLALQTATLTLKKPHSRSLKKNGTIPSEKLLALIQNGSPLSHS